MAKEWSVTLNTGNKIPAFGLGTFLSDPWDANTAVEAALKTGYRHIDTAHVYYNESEVGEALEKCIHEGVCKRQDVFITTKLWNTDHAKEDVLPACKASLEKLKVEYVDLYLIHWPVEFRKDSDLWKLSDDDKLGYDPKRMAECWEAMEDLVDKGLVKAIGISNFSITKTERLLQTAKIVPAVNQVECHPYLQQQKLKDYCDSKGIVLEAYTPLGNPGSPFREGEEPNILEDPVVKAVAAKHSVTPAQVCISFALHRGIVVFPKSVNPERISENIQATKVQLDASDMQRLRELDERNFRFAKADFFQRQGEKWENFWDLAEDEAFVVKP